MTWFTSLPTTMEQPAGSFARGLAATDIQVRDARRVFHPWLTCRRVIGRVNRRHSGALFAVAGFMWIVATALVLIVNAAANVWAACIVIALAVVAADQLRQH